MPVNDYQTFACDPAANVESNAAYVADATRSTGEVSGRANSSRSNKVWRQASMWAAALGMFLNDQNQDALDDGNPSNLMAKIKAAILSWVTSSITALINTNGQCRLVYSDATHIKLTLFNGNQIKIAGTSVSLPNGGVLASNVNVFVGGVAGQNLAANVDYLVACYMQGAVPTLSFWPAATYSHAPDTTAGNLGVEVIVGQPLHTLVGRIRTNGSSQFQIQGIGTISWFNRVAIEIGSGSTLNGVSTASPTFVNLNTAADIVFIKWDEAIRVDLTGFCSTTTSGGTGQAQIYIDNTAAGIAGYGTSPSQFQNVCCPTSIQSNYPEGAHTSSVYGAVGGAGGTSTFGLDQVVTTHG